MRADELTNLPTPTHLINEAHIEMHGHRFYVWYPDEGYVAGFDHVNDAHLWAGDMDEFDKEYWLSNRSRLTKRRNIFGRKYNGR